MQDQMKIVSASRQGKEDEEDRGRLGDLSDDEDDDIVPVDQGRRSKSADSRGKKGRGRGRGAAQNPVRKSNRLSNA